MIRKGILFLLLVLMIHDANAQRRKVRNLDKYDSQWIHFGFLLGLNSADFNLRLNDDFYRSDSVWVLESDRQAGFNLGIVSNLHLGDNFDLRFVPSLDFCQRNLNYWLVGKSTEQEPLIKIVESTFLAFPLELKFKSNRINNYRLYTTAGFRYMIDFVSQRDVENTEELVKLEKYDYGYTVGVGADFYMPLFKFGTEIKMYQGIPNMLVSDPAVFTTSIKSLRSRIFMLTLTFE